MFSTVLEFSGKQIRPWISKGLDFRNDAIEWSILFTFLSFIVIITTIYKVSSGTFTYKEK